MGVVNVGNQLITIKYFDPADSTIVNKRYVDIRPTGIYKGGLLTKVTDSSVTLAVSVSEVRDADYQVRVETRSAATISVAPATPYVVIRWTYVDGVVSNYADLLAVASGSIQQYDVIVGKCLYSGATLTGFDYGERTEPKNFENFLKVEATVPESMYVRIKSGWCSYGSSRLSIDNQLSPLITAPTVNPKIDLVYINNSGVIQVETGVESITPVAPDHTGKIVLAEIYTYVGMLTVTAAEITDARPWINLGGSGTSGAVDGYTTTFNNSDLTAGIITFTHGLSSSAIGSVTLINDLGNGYDPDYWNVIDTNNIEVGIASYGVISGTHTVVITAKV